MDLKDFFVELFEYNNHSNKQLIRLFIDNSGVASEKSKKLLSHVLNAHHIWNSRLQATKSRFGVWDLHELTTFDQMNQENSDQSTTVLDTIDLGAVVQYTNSKGNSFQNTGRDVLFHIINHSTYHRAQIATEFKSAGVEPPSTDYIMFKR